MNTSRKFLLGSLALLALTTTLSVVYSQVVSPNPVEEDVVLYDRLNKLYEAIEDNYYTEVSLKDAFSESIRGLLAELDPHSTFIDAVDYPEIEEQYRGNYQGIGVSFVNLDEKITVVDVSEDGPSDKAGLEMGDRIVEINGKSAVGITNDEIMERLRGPDGTSVDVGVERPGHSKLFRTTITRGQIPIRSVENAMMLDNKTGYVRVKKFTRPTAFELQHALMNMEKMGMKRLVLDLRGNGGGLLSTAISMTDLFLTGKRMIVYTDGQTLNSEQQFYSRNEGENWELPLVILIDHSSASASEIVSGALQDWDRALIVGETSFGKGLVQSGYILTDNSRLLLTTSHYYTPTGRLIQRPYKGLELETYMMEGLDDIDPNSSSESNDGLEDKPVYLTPSGRKVFGGGGITPDVEIKADRMFDPLVISLSNQLVSFMYGREYYWQHHDEHKDFTEYQANFQVTDEMLADFLKVIKQRDFEFYPRRGEKYSEAQLEAEFWKLKDQVKLLLKAELAQFYFGRSKGYAIRRLEKDTVLKSIDKLFLQADKLAENHQNINPDHFASRPNPGEK